MWLIFLTFLHRTTSVSTRSSREWRYSLKIRYIVQPCSYYIIDLCVILSELPVSGLSPHLHKCWPSPLLYPMIPLPFIHIHYHTELSHIFILQLFTTNIFLDFSFTHKFTHFLITKITIYINIQRCWSILSGGRSGFVHLANSWRLIFEAIYADHLRPSHLMALLKPKWWMSSRKYWNQVLSVDDIWSHYWCLEKYGLTVYQHNSSFVIRYRLIS